VLGNPGDAPTQALILSAAEAVTIAESARSECLSAMTDIDINSMSGGTPGR